jgi:hypothetical protein
LLAHLAERALAQGCDTLLLAVNNAMSAPLPPTGNTVSACAMPYASISATILSWTTL